MENPETDPERDVMDTSGATEGGSSLLDQEKVSGKRCQEKVSVYESINRKRCQCTNQLKYSG